MSAMSLEMACLSSPASSLICQLGAAMLSPPPPTPYIRTWGHQEAAQCPVPVGRRRLVPGGWGESQSLITRLLGDQDLSQHLSHSPPPACESRAKLQSAWHASRCQAGLRAAAQSYVFRGTDIPVSLSSLTKEQLG